MLIYEVSFTQFKKIVGVHNIQIGDLPLHSLRIINLEEDDVIYSQSLDYYGNCLFINLDMNEKSKYLTRLHSIYEILFENANFIEKIFEDPDEYEPIYFVVVSKELEAMIKLLLL